MNDFLAIVQTATGAPPQTISVALRPPVAFQSNRLYNVQAGRRRLILKEYLAEVEWHEAPLREFRALQRLRPLDVAPRPVFYRPAPHPLVLYEFMEGEMWDRMPPTAAQLRELAALWVRLSQLDTAALWPSRGVEHNLLALWQRMQKSVDAYVTWTAVYPPGRAAAARLQALLAGVRRAFSALAESPVQWCFGVSDPRFSNVISRPDGRLGLVDWEDSGLGDSARNLADLVTHPNQEDLLSWQSWQQVIRPFLTAHQQHDPDLEARLNHYLIIMPFFWLTLLLPQGMELTQSGRLAGWCINGMPANERLRRYLARATVGSALHRLSDVLARMESVSFFPDDAGA